MVVLSALFGFCTLLGQSLSEVYNRVKESVVIINTNERMIAPTPGRQEVMTAGLGSGVLISDDGKILSAAHVVQTADQVIVQFYQSEEMVPARIVSTAPLADVALLQLEWMPKKFTVATMGNSDQVQVGDKIFVVGAPYGISHSLTAGYISGRRKEPQMTDEMTGIELFQTDAAINQGNSGGPMFNLQGEVIGIVSHILSQSGGFEGIGFAITSNIARELMLEQPFFWTGIDGIYLEGPMAAAFNLPQPYGILVQKVAAGSIADRMGLRGGKIMAIIENQSLMLGGDFILKIENMPLSKENLTKTRTLINQVKSDQPLSFTILREGKLREVSVLKNQ